MSKLELTYPNQVPFGGAYSVVDPLTGITVSGHCLKNVIREVLAERRANGAPIGLELEVEVEQWICAKYPQECKPSDPKAFVHRQLGLAHIVAGSKVMLSQWFHGRKVVERAEAERRAQICAGCPMNVKFSKPCGGLCPELAAVVGAITGAQGTQFDWQLNSCAICKCLLQAAIWVEREVQWNVLDEDTKKQFEGVPHCWKKP